MDRVLAILGILLEEYDADSRPPAPEYKLPGEYSDMEIRRVTTYSGVRRSSFWLDLCLTQRAGHGTHCYEVATSGVSARTVGWTANVQVRNNVRGGTTGSKGFECSVERFDLRTDLRLGMMMLVNCAISCSSHVELGFVRLANQITNPDTFHDVSRLAPARLF